VVFDVEMDLFMCNRVLFIGFCCCIFGIFYEDDVDGMVLWNLFDDVLLLFVGGDWVAVMWVLDEGCDFDCGEWWGVYNI